MGAGGSSKKILPYDPDQPEVLLIKEKGEKYSEATAAKNETLTSDTTSSNTTTEESIPSPETAKEIVESESRPNANVDTTATGVKKDITPKPDTIITEAIPPSKLPCDVAA